MKRINKLLPVWLTVTECSNLTGLAPNTVRTYCEKKVFTCYQAFKGSGSPILIKYDANLPTFQRNNLEAGYYGCTKCNKYSDHLKICLKK